MDSAKWWSRAAWYDTWLLNRLTPKGVVFCSLFMSVCNLMARNSLWWTGWQILTVVSESSPATCKPTEVDRGCECVQARYLGAQPWSAWGHVGVGDSGQLQPWQPLPCCWSFDAAAPCGPPLLAWWLSSQHALPTCVSLTAWSWQEQYITIMMITIIRIILTTTTLLINKWVKRFPAHDDLDACRTCLVSPEQPVLCVPIRFANTTILTIREMIGDDTVADPGMHNQRPTTTTMKASDMSALVDHKHFHNVETLLYCPQKFSEFRFSK